MGRDRMEMARDVGRGRDGTPGRGSDGKEVGQGRGGNGEGRTGKEMDEDKRIGRERWEGEGGNGKRDRRGVEMGMGSGMGGDSYRWR